jgi:hypothetical protein
VLVVIDANRQILGRTSAMPTSSTSQVWKSVSSFPPLKRPSLICLMRPFVLEIPQAEALRCQFNDPQIEAMPAAKDDRAIKALVIDLGTFQSLRVCPLPSVGTRLRPPLIISHPVLGILAHIHPLRLMSSANAHRLGRCTTADSRRGLAFLASSTPSS